MKKNRSQLDTDVADADPWNRLAEKFNNYTNYRYSNASIQGNRLTPAGLPLPVAGMEAISIYCHDINPTMADRPIRDAMWLRTNYRDLKAIN